MEIIDRELISKLLKVKGETRGFNIKNDAVYLARTEGKKAGEELEDELKKLGCPISFYRLKDMGFYPSGWRAISLLVMKKRFSFTDKDIENVCAVLPRLSLVIRLFVKYFYSLDKIIEKVPDIWKKHWTVGEMSVKEFDRKKKYAIIVLKDFNLHPVFCHCLKGYIESLAKMVIKHKIFTCEEVECFFKRRERSPIFS